MKVTLAQIEARIAKVTYEIRDDRRTTVCEITLDNGWTERGESNCVDPAEFIKLAGEKAAYNKAIDGLWKCFAFVLREEMFGSKGDKA
jgi:hypothetical protein